MLFESGKPAVVASIRQRDLLNVWLRLYAKANGLPPVESYKPDRLSDEKQDLVYYRVEFDPHNVTQDATDPRSVAASVPKFRIESNGTRLSRVYGKLGGGMDLEEYLGPVRWSSVAPAYHTCAARALPVYATSIIADTENRMVTYERLLMPFGSSAGITHIVASLKAISEEGAFTLDNLMAVTAQPRQILNVVIDQGLSFPRYETWSDGEIEFD